MSTATAKAYKGMGMEGRIARWYAVNTRKSLHDFRALARRVADVLPSGSRVLEVAPGPGYFAIELARIGNFIVTGLDISKTFVEIASRNAREAGVEVAFEHGDAAAMPFADESFDFLLCRAAFKNFGQPVRALQEMHRVLKPGGRGLIIDLRRDAAPESMDRHVETMGLSAVNKVVTKLIFRWFLLRTAYTKAQFERMLAQTNFRSIDIHEENIGFEIRMTK